MVTWQSTHNNIAEPHEFVLIITAAFGIFGLKTCNTQEALALLAAKNKLTCNISRLFPVLGHRCDNSKREIYNKQSLWPGRSIMDARGKIVHD